MWSNVSVHVDTTAHSLITHAGCIAAGVGRALSRVCLSVCLSALYMENGLSYQHQTWLTYTLQ